MLSEGINTTQTERTSPQHLSKTLRAYAVTIIFDPTPRDDKHFCKMQRSGLDLSRGTIGITVLQIHGGIAAL